MAQNEFEERFMAFHKDSIYPYEDPIGTLSTLLNVHQFHEVFLLYKTGHYFLDTQYTW